MKNYIFLVWGSALEYRHIIKKKITEKFQIEHEFQISWDENMFIQNLNRFYFDSPTNIQIKKIETGTKPFLVYVINDLDPILTNIYIRDKKCRVNLNIYNLKLELRSLTGKGHKIHGSNTVDEARKNLLMLNIKKFRSTLSFVNPPGSNCWKSTLEALGFLNNFMSYIVLRGHDALKKNTFSQDIDLLVEDSLKASKILNATKCSNLKYRRNYIIKVKNNYLKIDLRDINDCYYDKKWSVNMLKKRKLNNEGFYLNDTTNQFYSLTYHILIHKYEIPKKYEKFIKDNGGKEKLKNKLKVFLKKRKYIITEPNDLTVAFNSEKKSVRRHLYLLARRFKNLQKLIPKKIMKLYAFTE